MPNAHKGVQGGRHSTSDNFIYGSPSILPFFLSRWYMNEGRETVKELGDRLKEVVNVIIFYFYYHDCNNIHAHIMVILLIDLKERMGLYSHMYLNTLVISLPTFLR